MLQNFIQIGFEATHLRIFLKRSL